MSYWDQQTQNNINSARQLQPDEQAIHDQNKAFLDWENAPGHNIADAPGLQDYINLGHTALNKANQERMGTGAMNLADDGSQPYIANLKQLHQDTMAQQYGAGLEDALAQKRAEVHGSVLPLASLATQRNLGVANASSGMFHNWSNVQTGPSWWQMLLGGAMQAGKAYLGGGG